MLKVIKQFLNCREICRCGPTKIIINNGKETADRRLIKFSFLEIARTNP